MTTLYPLNSNTPTGGFQALQQDGTAPTTATSSAGWTVGKTAASDYSYLVGSTKRAASTFATTVLPGSNAPSALAGMGFRSQLALSGSFPAGTWTFTFRWICTTASSQAGKLRVQVWRSSNSSGSGATRISSADITAASPVAVTSTSIAAVDSFTWSAPTITLNNEFLFITAAWQITTASGSNNGDVLLQVGSGCIITPTAFQTTGYKDALTRFIEVVQSILDAGTRFKLISPFSVINSSAAIEGVSAASVTSSPTWTSTSGNLLIAGAFTAGTGAGSSEASPPFADGGTNTWTSQASAMSSYGRQLADIGYAKNITGKASEAVTFSMSAAGSPSVVLLEAVGCDRANPVSVAATYTTVTTPVATIDTPLITPPAGQHLLVVIAGNDTGSTNQDVINNGTGTATWTVIKNDGPAGEPILIAYAVVTADGTSTYGVTYIVDSGGAGTSPGIAGISAFRAAVGATYVSANLRQLLRATSLADISTRVKLQVLNYVNSLTRVNLRAPNNKDVTTRFKIMVQQYTNAVQRLRLVVLNYRNAPTRLLLRVLNYANTNTRISVRAQNIKDSTIRFVLGALNLSYANATIRQKLLGVSFVTAVTRLRLQVLSYRNANTRIWLARLNYANANLRQRLISISFATATTRVKLGILNYANATVRLRLGRLNNANANTRQKLVSQSFSNPSTRLKLRVLNYQNSLIRFSLRALNFANASTRLAIVSSRYITASTRQLLRSLNWSVANTRTFISVLNYRNVNLRTSLRVPGYKFGTLRLIVKSSFQTVDTTYRFRLGQLTWTNALQRIRLVISNIRYAQIRQLLTARQFSNAIVRFRLNVANAMNASTRERLRATNYQNANMRGKVYAQNFRDSGRRSKIVTRSYQFATWRYYIRSLFGFGLANSRYKLQVGKHDDSNSRLIMIVSTEHDASMRLRLVMPYQGPGPRLVDASDSIILGFDDLAAPRLVMK